MNQSSQTEGKRARILPWLIALALFLALMLIAYASGQRISALGQRMALEDAEMMNWWQQQQRASLSASATALAQRVSDSVDFMQLIDENGLSQHPGYIAWIAVDKSVKGEFNPGSQLGDPSATKMFAFAPAVGYAVGDFWHTEIGPFFMSMAPVPADRGGGVILIQSPLDDMALQHLADLTGRDVMLYSFEKQAPLASSNPALLSDPPSLSARWISEVATGQEPDSIRTSNRQGEQVVGMTAFSDFAGISYSGYLALVESGQELVQRISWVTYAIVILIATALLLLGCWILQRRILNYLSTFRSLSYYERRSFKRWTVVLTILFLIPPIVAGWFIINSTSAATKFIDLRTTDIAQRVLFDAIDNSMARIERYAAGEALTGLVSNSPDTLAEQVRLANDFDFTLIEGGSELVQVSAPDREIPDDAAATVQAFAVGSVSAIPVGKDVVVAAKQTLPDGTSAIGGIRLGKRLRNIVEVAPVDLSLFENETAHVTSLTERELETMTFVSSIEDELKNEGEVSYTQTVGWHPSKLAAKALDTIESAPWRLVLSQASINWTNGIRAYQGFSVGVLATALVLIGILMLTILNLDKPMMLRRLFTGYLFILPASIWLIWWQLGPALFTAYLSFHKWSVLNPAKPYVGLHNYRLIWGDEKFWNAMGNTFYYLLQIPISLVLALALALALNRKLRGIRFLRTIYYMPAVTSIVVVALMWQLLYNKDLGIFNYLLDFVGLGPYGWLQSPTMAMPSIMGMEIWLGLGARMLLFLAGLQSIPHDFYEAADVDGANPWSKFRHITIPLLAPTTFFVFTTAIIQSFQVFGPIYVLTSGGPAGATDVAVYRIYFEAWQNLRFGYASSETVILFAFLFVVTALQFRYFGRNVSYG
ncbi:sugar ABC transporter permease [Chloroflexi bacterium TSY]|nr:sugar ABC transporter permease [Chloroflexi bacterium TSY]